MVHYLFVNVSINYIYLNQSLLMRTYDSIFAPSATLHPPSAQVLLIVTPQPILHPLPRILSIILQLSFISTLSSKIELRISTFFPILQLFPMQLLLSFPLRPITDDYITLALPLQPCFSSNLSEYMVGISTSFCLGPRIILSKFNVSQIFLEDTLRMQVFCSPRWMNILRGLLQESCES